MMPASGGGGAVFPFSDDFESGDICAWSVAVGWGGTECPIGPEETTTYATYDSSGRLHQLAREGGAAPVSIFYFAGRPVATWDPDPDVQFRLLTTDHLGTPIHQMTLGGTTDWLGGFEPYGGDFAGAANAGLFLRLPGQWNDGTWTDAALGTEISYNVHRWYESGTGRYTKPDPLGLETFLNLYTYVDSRPTFLIDWDGRQALPGGSLPWAIPCVLAVRDAVRSTAGGQTRYQHCLGNCLISQHCPGGGITASAASRAKEFSDLWKCYADGLGGNCDSAFQATDFRDNRQGRECKPPESCADHCGDLRNAPEPPPGPFGSVGGGSGW